ncbi:MAG: hypothetical protein F6K48_22945 [Okeania sp. SIO3H1]|nr:hypothetical protein [Okeania sp. SIO3H1]
MASNLLQKIWRVLNTEIEFNLLESETVKGGVEGGKAVFEIAEVISCPVEYLHFGRGKAGGRRQEAGGKKRSEGKRFFYH